MFRTIKLNIKTVVPKAPYAKQMARGAPSLNTVSNSKICAKELRHFLNNFPHLGNHPFQHPFNTGL